MWRNQDPLSSKRVVPSMGMLLELELCHGATIVPEGVTSLPATGEKRNRNAKEAEVTGGARLLYFANQNRISDGLPLHVHQSAAVR